MSYLVLKVLHIIGATVILGTGSGIAFFMLMAHRSGNADFIARTAGIVVTADFLFTAGAALLQPVTGWLLMRQTGAGLADGWLPPRCRQARPQPRKPWPWGWTRIRRDVWL